MTLPGILFASLWPRVEPKTGELLARPWEGRAATEFSDLVSLLAGASEIDVPDEVEAYLGLRPVGFGCSVDEPDERAFVVMCALDQVAMSIHPAFPSRLPGIARAPSAMLAAMKAARTSDGHYADIAGIGMVVPKGHLMKRNRPNDREDASGTDLAHQFEHLTLVAHLGHGRSLRFLSPPPSKFLVPPDRAECVGLAPIAEDKDDLRFEPSKRGKRAYLDTLPGAVDLPDRMGVAVTSLLDDGAGIIVLPELVTGPGVADTLSGTLRARGSTGTPALVLAGTGATVAVHPGSNRPYNEAVLMSAGGRILARQRKLHVFNMDKGRMKACGIAPAPGCETRNHLEDAAPGGELLVCDLHGLGRVMVLICEDLQQQTPGGDVALVVRPDWILTPVLDISQTEGRWTHARAIEIGRKTQSRVIVSCSATLGVRMAKAERMDEVTQPYVNIGICFDGYEDNRVKLVPATGALTPDRTAIKWESATWPKHKTILPTP